MRRKTNRKGPIELKALLYSLRSDDAGEADRAVELLKARKDPACLKPLLRRMMNWSGYRDIYRFRAAHVLRAFGENATLRQYLMMALLGSDVKRRIAAAWTMAQAPQFAAIAEIKRRAATEKESELRGCLLQILGSILWIDRSWEQEFFDIIAAATASNEKSIRSAGYEILSHYWDPRCAAIVKRASKDKDHWIRIESLRWRQNVAENRKRLRRRRL
jgi:hypothetical protein